ncbi:cytochrome P450 [Streptomyces sp. URMC 123]|uniref:cytochrome P450 n=1 Tax=Streptomyces sp. URMC 123 TaxID=3423403 RepID=UPI003F1CD9EF
MNGDCGKEVPWAPGGLFPVGHLPALRHGIGPLALRMAGAGPLVRARFGPLVLYFVNDGALAHDILVDKVGVFGHEDLARGVRTAAPRAMSTLDGEAYKERRRLSHPAFSQSSARFLTSVVARTATRYTDRWRPYAPLRLDQEMLTLCADVLLRCQLRSAVGPETVAAVASGARVLTKGIVLRALAPSWYHHAPTPENLAYRRAVRRLRDAVAEVHRRHAPSPDGADVLTLLRRAACPDHGGARITPESVLDETAGLLIAGVLAPAMAMAWAWHELAGNREVESAVQREADAYASEGRLVHEPEGAVGPGEAAKPERGVESGEAAKPTETRLPHTVRVITETLRHHALPLLPRRARREAVIGGYRVPEGARLVLNLSGLHHDPAVYARPHVFDPDRWLTMTVRDAGTAYMPMGAGVRHCLGASFVGLHLPVMLAAVASRYQFRPVGRRRPAGAAKGVVPDPYGLTMIAVPRTPDGGAGAGGGLRP